MSRQTRLIISLVMRNMVERMNVERSKAHMHAHWRHVCVEWICMRCLTADSKCTDEAPHIKWVRMNSAVSLSCSCCSSSSLDDSVAPCRSLVNLRTPRNDSWNFWSSTSLRIRMTEEFSGKFSPMWCVFDASTNDTCHHRRYWPETRICDAFW